MSYNIDSVDYISGRLGISDINVAAALEAVSEEDRPDCCFLHDLVPGDISAYGFWCYDGSGHGWDAFKLALTFTCGKADLLVCWEGGDSFSGLRVSDGAVIEHKVVHSLGEEVK